MFEKEKQIVQELCKQCCATKSYTEEPLQPFANVFAWRGVKGPIIYKTHFNVF